MYYYFVKELSSVSSENFETNYADAEYEHEDYACAGQEEFSVGYDKSSGYKYLILCVEVKNAAGDSSFLDPVIVDLSDYNSYPTTSKTGLSITGVDIRDHIITLEADYSGEVTVFLYVDGKSSTTLGSFDVAKGDTVEFDYSKQSAAIKLLAGASSDVEIVFQLVSSDETYKTVKVQVFE